MLIRDTKDDEIVYCVAITEKQRKDTVIYWYGALDWGHAQSEGMHPELHNWSLKVVNCFKTIVQCTTNLTSLVTSATTYGVNIPGMPLIAFEMVII